MARLPGVNLISDGRGTGEGRLRLLACKWRWCNAGVLTAKAAARILHSRVLHDRSPDSLFTPLG